MANRVLVNEDSLRDIAAAIKEQSGDYETSFTPGEMGNAIRNLPIGEGGGSGSNVYVDGVSILQDEDGRIYTAIGGGFGESQGGGEGQPQLVLEVRDLFCTPGDNGWITTEHLLDGCGWGDFINPNQLIGANFRTYNEDLGEDEESEAMWATKLIKFEDEVYYFEFTTEEIPYSEMRLTPDGCVSLLVKDLASFNSPVHALSGITMYILKEQIAAVDGLSITPGADGVFNTGPMLGDEGWTDVISRDDKLNIEITLNGTDLYEFDLNLEEYEDIYIRYTCDNEVFSEVMFEDGAISLIPQLPEDVMNYTVHAVKLFKKPSGGEPGVGIIPIDGRFIPVDNETIFFDGMFLRANSVQEWRVEEMINEALGGIENGTY